ncbi:potassium channel subfamily T member 2-like isoform X4 [Biomphalaria glabrata]|uniref:Potassium channel subfamily T member 2-like isoform X4 n=1 Tax=Biomphalaria glabrata TaxID=6526 RepID=A0A9W2Z9T0_BIOGL|nr:potassium channel subfamily T member 2-like isoform X4 [Biomphalaria glabrata]
MARQQWLGRARLGDPPGDVHKVEFDDIWSETSSEAYNSPDTSIYGDMFRNDDIDGDDYIDRWHGRRRSRSIFTVCALNGGYVLSPEERKRLEALSSGHPIDPEDRNAPVKYFTHELSFRGRLRRFFIRNSTTRLACTFFDLALKTLICVIYVTRVSLDNVKDYECAGAPCSNAENDTRISSKEVNWYVLLWVQRSWTIWAIEVALAVISLAKALLMIYIATRGHRMDHVLTLTFLLEICCSVPILITVVFPKLLKQLFVPVFLNCWLAKRSMEKIYNDLHLTRQRFQTISVTLLQQMVMLVVNIICLVFINICFIQHIQRASSEKQLSMFDSLYFVIVTFSTVGYGDIYPDIWLGRLFTIIMICVAFASIPRHIEGLVSTYMERQKAGGEYSQRSAQRNRHVIVCSSAMIQDTLMDFLNEFYAHPKLEDHTVILLCPQELDSNKQVILKDPKWAHRVIYMRGSSLKDIDLKRCRVHQADACFFLAPRPTQDKAKADRHTILRSWAVKDFAPNCKQYIQLFKAKNKLHVKFAEHVVCEDEFKYALLANNCLYPGLSTLVSLLVHTSTGQEGLVAPEPWQQVYGRHSGNEIYHIQLHKSLFFNQYEGETFPQASADAHHRFGVALLAVLDSESPSPRLQLNPGPEYRLKANDYCFYMSVTREEYSKISPEALKSIPRKKNENIDFLSKEKEDSGCHYWHHSSEDEDDHKKTFRSQIALALQKYHNDNDVTINVEDTDEAVFDTITSLMGEKITRMARNQTAPNFTIGNEPNGKSLLQKPGVRLKKGSVSFSSIPLLHAEEPKQTDIPKVDEEDDKTDSTEQLMGEEDSKDGSEIGGLHNVDHRHGAGRVLQFYTDMGQEKLTTGPPPVTIFSGARRTNCHIMSEKRHLCCLEWGQNCQHCSYKNANDKRWHHQLIILAAEHASSGIFNFIVPLRSSFIGVNGLSPIVLLLEEKPDVLFLDTIAQFPLVYYMIGKIQNVDDLLVAGINQASHLVVVNRDSDSDYGGEEILADSETIVAVQTIFRLFPNTYVVTELSQASNMRFMQFSAQDVYSQKASRLEQKLKDTMTTNLNHIFRLPFAAGQVFSASMLDTLLYQTFVKGYLISFVRLLLGIDAEEGSGHLSSIRVKRSTVQKFPEYGDLYDGLCSATGEIPFAIYRTEKVTNTEPNEEPSTFFGEHLSDFHFQYKKKKPGKKRHDEGIKPSQSTISRHRFSMICKPDQDDLGDLIRNRLMSLELTSNDYSDVRRRPNTLSYVITNPSPKRRLKMGDIVYVIQPSSMYAKPSKRKFYMNRIHRSHSFAGTESSNSLNNNLTKDVGLGVDKKVGRFTLHRNLSDKDMRPRSVTVIGNEAATGATKV